jgi:hypothetical protein
MRLAQTLKAYKTLTKCSGYALNFVLAVCRKNVIIVIFGSETASSLSFTVKDKELAIIIIVAHDFGRLHAAFSVLCLK